MLNKNSSTCNQNDSNYEENKKGDEDEEVKRDINSHMESMLKKKIEDKV